MNGLARASSDECNEYPKPMSRKEPSSTEVTYRILEELEAFQGIYWQEVRGEFHGAYDEAAIWILLSDAADLPRAHRRFRDTVSSRFYLAHFTVSYMVRTTEGEMILDFLGDNDAIERAGASRPLGTCPSLKQSDTSVFRASVQPARKPERVRRHIH